MTLGLIEGLVLIGDDFWRLAIISIVRLEFKRVVIFLGSNTLRDIYPRVPNILGQHSLENQVTHIFLLDPVPDLVPSSDFFESIYVGILGS